MQADEKSFLKQYHLKYGRGYRGKRAQNQVLLSMKLCLFMSVENLKEFLPSEIKTHGENGCNSLAGSQIEE